MTVYFYEKELFILKTNILKLFMFLVVITGISVCSIIPVYANEYDDLENQYSQIIEVEDNDEDNENNEEKNDNINPFNNILSFLNKSYFSYNQYGVANSFPIAFAQKSLLLTEQVPECPLYNQLDYPNVAYGKYGSLASHGCGLVCLSMASSYLLDEIQDPVVLAKQFGHYNTERGSYWILFEDSAEIMGLNLQERTWDTESVMKALANGQIVISLQSKGIFTSGGHFILLTGLTEDGKILVNDPNGRNYKKNQVMIEGFLNGFTEEQIFSHGGPYWIYAPKELSLKEKDTNMSLGLLLKLMK